MITETKRYDVHVQGQIHGLVDDEYIHTYTVDHKPASMDEVAKIAGDFQSLKKVRVEEIVIRTEKRLIKL